MPPERTTDNREQAHRWAAGSSPLTLPNRLARRTARQSELVVGVLVVVVAALLLLGVLLAVLLLLMVLPRGVGNTTLLLMVLQRTSDSGLSVPAFGNWRSTSSCTRRRRCPPPSSCPTLATATAATAAAAVALPEVAAPRVKSDCPRLAEADAAELHAPVHQPRGVVLARQRRAVGVQAHPRRGVCVCARARVCVCVCVCVCVEGGGRGGGGARRGREAGEEGKGGGGGWLNGRQYAVRVCIYSTRRSVPVHDTQLRAQALPVAPLAGSHHCQRQRQPVLPAAAEGKRAERQDEAPEEVCHLSDSEQKCSACPPPTLCSQSQAVTQSEVVHRYLAVRQIFNELVACHHCTMRSGT
jgi:hypothetical protein